MSTDPTQARGVNPMAGSPDPCTSGVSTDRLREIQTRLASGFYDTSPVIDHVARRVSAELGDGN